jgi:hypothetical protein
MAQQDLPGRKVYKALQGLRAKTELMELPVQPVPMAQQGLPGRKVYKALPDLRAKTELMELPE